MNRNPAPACLVFPMQRGPFQNNGASPWYCTVSLGTPAQLLKLALDSGTNINWITSTLCADDQCQHFANGRFDFRASSTFAFTDCLRRLYSFGPWGTMQVEAAADVLTTPAGVQIDTQLLLAAAYDGEQFKQLDWDGGLGLPCSSAYVEGRSSFMLQTLLREGQLDPAHPFVTFDWNGIERRGNCRMGAVDPAKTQGPCLFLPWSVYSGLPGIEYIWSTPLKSFSLGDERLAGDLTFTIDSGSSQFKGDERLMHQTLARIAQGDRPDLVLGFAEGEITLGADLYTCLIEEGPQKGQVQPQFAPLGLPGLVLVGSVVMEHCYTVYEYRAVQCSSDVCSLAPVGVWLFNRPDGPQIITRSTSRAFQPGARSASMGNALGPVVASEPASIAGTWKNDYGSLMTLGVSGQQVYGRYQSSTGSTGSYAVTGWTLGSGATRTESQPVALAIDWHDLGGHSEDPCWHWTSGLSGQLSSTEKGDVLTLMHLLIASGDFPGFASQGTYVDKLVYQRVTSGHPIKPTEPTASGPVENLLTGHWVAGDGTALVVSVERDPQQRYGCVQGYMASARIDATLTGFTDINATTGQLALQSVSLTAINPQQGTVCTLCGTLDLAGDQLNLQVLTSSPVAPEQAYLATKLASLSFIRATSPAFFLSTADSRNTRYSTY